MKIKKILIVGGEGYLGRHLIENLKEKTNLYILDKQIKKKIKSKKIKYFDINLLKKTKPKNLPNNLDVVFFFAGITGGPLSLNIKNFKKYLDSNCEILLNFFEIIKTSKIKKIIFTSTEHVYGDETKKNFNALKNEPIPKNFYGVSKLLSEKILYNFYKKKLTSVDIFRFPRVISPKKKNFISKMKLNALKNHRVNINNLNSKFNLIYIDDFLSALECSMLQINTKFRILNIFNDSKPISLMKITQEIKKRFKKNFYIKFYKKQNLKDHNPLNLEISNSYTKKILKWNPKFNNLQIVNKVINSDEAR